jgi:phasin family protein
MESTPRSLFADYTRMIGQFKLPGIDVAAILESRRKDIEALLATNTAALAGMQALGQKHAEIVGTTMTGLQSLVTQRTAPGGEPFASAGELVQQVWRKSLANMRELADTVCKTQSDSLAMISRRVAENVEESRVLLQPKK